MITLARVDNRLIHGQVVSTWIPFTQAQEVVVADEEAARSPLVRAAMEMAVPPQLRVTIESPGAIDWDALEKSPRRVIVLVRDVADAEAAFAAGMRAKDLNLGNVHFGDGRKAVSPSVYLADRELDALARIAARGVHVQARALPTDPVLDLDGIRKKQKEAP